MREQVLLLRLGIRLERPQPLDLARNNQVFIFAEGNAVLLSESLGSFRNEIHMRAVTQNLARRPNRIRNVLDTSDATRAEGCSVHNEGIELDFAVAVQKAASPGVESFVVFHNHNCFFSGIERRAALLEHAPTRGRGILHAVEVSLDKIVRNGPGATVDEENGKNGIVAQAGLRALFIIAGTVTNSWPSER